VSKIWEVSVVGRREDSRRVIITKQQQPKSYRQSFHFNNLQINLVSHANTKHSISDERRRMKGTRKITVDLACSNRKYVQLIATNIISYTQETVMRDTLSEKKEEKSNFV
jgi:hypothetical protein